jgi:hypothetical protein
MSPEAQRIAIAEACGWRREIAETLILKIRSIKWYAPDEFVSTGKEPPDYINDLNAMHEAEKALNTSQKILYLTAVPRIVRNDMFEAMCATAAQRAEAFLRTIGKWAE